MTDQVKLSREEIGQLEEANARALENEIASLGGHFKNGRRDYKEFWLHSDKIHDTFRRITPLKKSDRGRLWDAFVAAREIVRKKQDAGRRYSQWLMDKRREAVAGFMQEVEDILARPAKSDADVEELLYLQDSLRSMTEEGWQGFPDTPDIAMASLRLDGKAGGREMEELKRTAAKSRKKSSHFLEKGASARLEELTREIQELKENRSGLAATSMKNRLREIRAAIQSPILLREQKELLLKMADEIPGASKSPRKISPAGGEPAQETKSPEEKIKADVPKRPRPSIAPALDKNLEVEALLGDLELSVSKKKKR